jgi:hypothetical protein
VTESTKVIGFDFVDLERAVDPGQIAVDEHDWLGVTPRLSCDCATHARLIG